jgi:glycerol-3-phosphate cytidylyltransferase
MIKDKKVGFTCSTFDLLHAGHILMLEEAKQQCDYLICGLQTDPTIDRPDTKNKPVQTVVERYIQLRAVRYVDEIIVYSTEQDLIDLLQFLPIDIRILGEEYRDKNFTGRKECEDLAIAFYFNGRTHRFSSTELRKRVASLAPPTLSESDAKPASMKVHSWTEP